MPSGNFMECEEKRRLNRSTAASRLKKKKKGKTKESVKLGRAASGPIKGVEPIN